MLLGSRSFKGNVLGKHMQLQGITPAHFCGLECVYWNEHTARLFAGGCRPQRMGWPTVSSEGILGSCPALPRRAKTPMLMGFERFAPILQSRVGDRKPCCLSTSLRRKRRLLSYRPCPRVKKVPRRRRSTRQATRREAVRAS